MAEEEKTYQDVIDLIEEIKAKRDPSRKYIFRGTVIEFDKVNYDDKGDVIDKPTDKFVSSQIYREYSKEYKGDKGVDFGAHYKPIEAEGVSVEEARRLFPPNTTNIEILTDIRHFEGDTTLIDFSRDLNVALFFACNGRPKHNGQIILLPEDEFLLVEDNATPIDNIDYDNPQTWHNRLIEPARTKHSEIRVLGQSSVFIHAPDGYIDVDKENNTHSIDSNIKKVMMKYLEELYNIKPNTIYNDFHGFLKNQNSFKDSIMASHHGGLRIGKGESSK